MSSSRTPARGRVGGIDNTRMRPKASYPCRVQMSFEPRPLHPNGDPFDFSAMSDGSGGERSKTWSQAHNWWSKSLAAKPGCRFCRSKPVLIG